MNVVPFVTEADVAQSLPRIVAHLEHDGLIAYPTETVYGFGCLLRDPALAALAQLKSREAGKPFLILVLDESGLSGLEWTPSARKLAAAFWPGPLTLVLNVHGDFPAHILAENG